MFGIESISKSQVSRFAAALDELVDACRTRRSDGSPYPMAMLDALVVEVREAGRIVNVCVVHSPGVNKDGYRESLGVVIVTQDDGTVCLGTVCLAFPRELVAALAMPVGAARTRSGRCSARSGTAACISYAERTPPATGGTLSDVVGESETECLVLREPPLGDVEPSREPDAGMAESVLEELAQRGKAGGLLDPTRVEPDAHERLALLTRQGIRKPDRLRRQLPSRVRRALARGRDPSENAAPLDQFLAPPGWTPRPDREARLR
jgi:Transposase and inactivated derivatives